MTAFFGLHENSLKGSVPTEVRREGSGGRKAGALRASALPPRGWPPPHPVPSARSRSLLSASVQLGLLSRMVTNFKVDNNALTGPIPSEVACCKT